MFLFPRLPRLAKVSLVRSIATAVDAAKPLTPVESYNMKVKAGRLRDDEYQRGILKSMDGLFTQLQHYQPPRLDAPVTHQSGISGMFSSLFGKKQPEPDSVPRGIYLYGDVGCGKTMLMDLFYDTIPPHLTKKRMHFHQFMQGLHKRSHELKIKHGSQDADVMAELAWEMSQQATVFCLDEFQVTDVADAMLLRRLLDMVLMPDHGLVLFTTSNRAPDDLYINGVQRESFIPCIELIKKQTNVIFLDSPTDYRKVPRPVSSVYYSPPKDLQYHSKECKKQRDEHVENWYLFFAQGHPAESNIPITVWGRELIVPKCSPPYVAQFTFKQLCGQAYAAGDYLALATDFESMIVTDIPYLSIDSRDEVRRFITLLDAVYDNHSRMVVTAAAPFEDIFVEPEDIGEDGYQLSEKGAAKLAKEQEEEAAGVHTKDDDDPLVQQHGFDKKVVEKANLFGELDEERFAFARALSRLKHMSTQDWVDHIPHREHLQGMPKQEART